MKSFSNLLSARRGAAFRSRYGVILFYIFYLGTIWSFNIAMSDREDSAAQRRKFAKVLCRANIFLAAGDTAMFIAFLVGVFVPGGFCYPRRNAEADAASASRRSNHVTHDVRVLLLPGTVLPRAVREGRMGRILLIAIFCFSVARLLLHYNPENVWFSMLLPPGQPNYSAWLRNTPLFIYGLLAVIAIGYLMLARIVGDQRRRQK